MIPGNVDPRRPDKVQRYKAPQANGNAPVEDLTPDYMNILGPDSATANAAEASEIVKSAEPQPQQLVQPSQPQQEDSLSSESSIQSTNGTNVIPTSPQYGVAIMSNDVPSEATTGSTDTVVETTAKSEGEGGGGGNNKDMHSTPSRNDRFKVVKIASLEPFRRGRWKCMDYVDENPPPANSQSKSSQSTSNLQMGNNIYLQTQSLPQQHFQQMLVQGNFANAPHYYNVPSQMMPQSQYYYPAQSMQQLPPGAIQPQFINAANQQYFAQNVVPHSAAFSNYTNVQYVPSNLIQNQGSAFVPTTQNVVNSQLPPNFQQSQTYAGPPSGAQPIVNGHAYPPPPSEPQVVVAPSSLPTQVAKNVILTPNANQIPPTIMPTSNNPNMQQQYSNAAAYAANQNITQVVSTVPMVPVVSAQSVNHIPTSVNQVQPMSSVIPQQQHQQQAATTAPVSAATAAAVAAAAVTLPNIIMQQQPQPYDPNMPTNVYTNPQFVASVNSLPMAAEGVGGEAGDDAGSEATENAGGDDPAKANPVVNAIDNKIEQAMDLVKSHLMYTVREEVEVLKEKIAELMERIQQLETENTFLKQQIPKGTNTNPSGTPDPPQ